MLPPRLVRLKGNMDISTWTLTVVGIGVSLTALLFSVLQYLNTRGRPKRVVIRRALYSGLGISIVLYLVGLGILSNRPARITATTESAVAVDIAPLQSTTNDAIAPQPQRSTSLEPFEVTVPRRTTTNAPATDSELTLAYGYERLGSVLHVKPEMPYLSLLSRGGPIQGLRSSFRWTYPELSVKVSTTRR